MSSSLPPLPIEEDMIQAGIYPAIPLRHRMIMHDLSERVRVLTEQVEHLMSAANTPKAPGKLLTDKDIVPVQAHLHGVGTECPICLQPFCRSEQTSPVVALRSCGHAFHHTCISKWALCAPTCPICRKDV
jgi:hypothetical protein